MTTHDELIWTHLDGECSPEEEAMFTRLLENDLSFREKYNTIVTLDNQLSKHINIPLDSQLRDRMVTSLLSALPVSTATTRPLKWVLGPGWLAALCITGMAALAMAYRFGDDASGLPFTLPQPDPKISGMVTLICMAFLLLTLMDQALKRWFGKHKGAITILV